MNQNLKILNGANFDATVKEEKVSLVDFWAEWCGPCRMLLPTIDKIADEAGTKYNICKVNVDECEDLAARFGIMTIPTLLIFKKGEVKGKMVGVRTKEAILAELAKY